MRFKKIQIFLSFFFSCVFFFIINTSAFSQILDDPALVEEIGVKLNKYKKDYEDILKAINEVSAIEKLNIKLKMTNERFENYSKANSSTIENNDELGGICETCLNLKESIDLKIKELIEGDEQKIKKKDITNKLNRFLTDYRKMKSQGELYVKEENRDSLQILRQGEQCNQLSSKTEAMFAENEELIKGDPELTVLCDSIRQTKEQINKLYIPPTKDIWGIITKIAIVFAMIFFAVMIYNIIKSKKMLKTIKKPNDTPSI